MKSTLKISIFVIAAGVIIESCAKEKDNFNAAANHANTAGATFSLNNRVVAGFVTDAATLCDLPPGSLPAKYNIFRKQLTYGTILNANKPKLYNLGDTIVILAFLRGDDAAIAERSINFKFTGLPTAFSNATAVNKWVPVSPHPPISPIQSAEDSIRGFALRSIDVLRTVSFPTITEAVSDTLTINRAATGVVNGITTSTYLVQLNYIIITELSGILTSINLL